MKYVIDNVTDVPAYLQLYKQVRDDIVKGIYLPGSKLPSKRIIADEIGVSTVTIEHAYALLCDEGYIESRERSGYFVIFRADDGFVASAAEERHPIHYTHHHENPTTIEFPFSVLAKTMRKVISDLGGDEGTVLLSPFFLMSALDYKGTTEPSRCLTRR